MRRLFEKCGGYSIVESFFFGEAAVKKGRRCTAVHIYTAVQRAGWFFHVVSNTSSSGFTRHSPQQLTIHTPHERREYDDDGTNTAAITAAAVEVQHARTSTLTGTSTIAVRVYCCYTLWAFVYTRTLACRQTPRFFWCK